jgi:catechol 2,3-dioxygenase-like lactoylglutathione lyase family enzyme
MMPVKRGGDIVSKTIAIGGTVLSLKTKISTPQWKEAATFYQDIFGLKQVEAWDEPTDKGIILAIGNAPHTSLIEIYASDTVHEFGGLSLQFKVADLDAFLSALPKAVVYTGPSARPWGARYAFLVDPAGVSIVVFDGPTF